MEYKLEQEQHDVKKTEFWGDDPNVLFQELSFFPTEHMNMTEKLNATTRLIIVFSFVIWFFTHRFFVLLTLTLCLVAIYLFHLFHINKHVKDGFSTNDIEEYIDSSGNHIVSDVLRENGIKVSANIFDKPSSTNPFSNVMIPDYEYNVNKKPAPPAYTQKVGDDILSQAKQLVKDLNPGQPDIADKLFTHMGDEFLFEQSLRNYNSTAGSTIPNDQTAFSQFLYGDMVSSKEGNLFAQVRQKSNYNLY